MPRPCRVYVSLPPLLALFPSLGSQTILRMMRLVLRNGGAQDVQQAKDGREGLDTVLREHAAGRPFDLVITDIQVKYALVGLG